MFVIVIDISCEMKGACYMKSFMFVIVIGVTREMKGACYME